MRNFFERKNYLFMKNKNYKLGSDYKTKRKEKKFKKIESDNNDYGLFADDENENIEEIWNDVKFTMRLEFMQI